MKWHSVWLSGYNIFVLDLSGFFKPILDFLFLSQTLNCDCRCFRIILLSWGRLIGLVRVRLFKVIWDFLEISWSFQTSKAHFYFWHFNLIQDVSGSPLSSQGTFQILFGLLCILFVFIPHFSGLFRYIPDFPDLFWNCQDYLRLLSFWTFIDRFRNIRVIPFCLFWFIPDSQASYFN